MTGCWDVILGATKINCGGETGRVVGIGGGAAPTHSTKIPTACQFFASKKALGIRLFLSEKSLIGCAVTRNVISIQSDQLSGMMVYPFSGRTITARTGGLLLTEPVTVWFERLPAGSKAVSVCKPLLTVPNDFDWMSLPKAS